MPINRCLQQIPTDITALDRNSWSFSGSRRQSWRKRQLNESSELLRRSSMATTWFVAEIWCNLLICLYLFIYTLATCSIRAIASLHWLPWCGTVLSVWRGWHCLPGANSAVWMDLGLPMKKWFGLYTVYALNLPWISGIGSCMDKSHEHRVENMATAIRWSEKHVIRVRSRFFLSRFLVCFSAPRSGRRSSQRWKSSWAKGLVVTNRSPGGTCSYADKYACNQCPGQRFFKLCRFLFKNLRHVFAVKSGSCPTFWHWCDGKPLQHADDSAGQAVGYIHGRRDSDRSICLQGWSMENVYSVNLTGSCNVDIRYCRICTVYIIYCIQSLNIFGHRWWLGLTAFAKQEMLLQVPLQQKQPVYVPTSVSDGFAGQAISVASKEILLKLQFYVHLDSSNQKVIKLENYFKNGTPSQSLHKTSHIFEFWYISLLDGYHAGTFSACRCLAGKASTE